MGNAVGVRNLGRVCASQDVASLGSNSEVERKPVEGDAFALVGAYSGVDNREVDGNEPRGGGAKPMGH